MTKERANSPSCQAAKGTGEAPCAPAVGDEDDEGVLLGVCQGDMLAAEPLAGLLLLPKLGVLGCEDGMDLGAVAWGAEGCE
eukprot:430659-Pelagomonas_calceolata.AAC.2